MNEIIIKQNGFVTGDALLNPIAYAGEMNSRTISVTHPMFTNCHYQIIAIKNNYPYIIGVVDGEALFPPSLLNTAVTLECQFVVVKNNDNIDINANLCDCQFGSSDDCSKMVWKSDSFKLIVKQGLNLNNLSPIPPYEQLVDIYNNISKAKLSVEKAKVENEQLLQTVSQKIDILQQLSTNQPNQPNPPVQPDNPNSGNTGGDSNSDCNCNHDEHQCNHDVDDIPLITF